MNTSSIIWDIETIPDLKGFAAANDLVDKTDTEICEAIGEKFPKHVYHSIVCIGELVAHRKKSYWAIDALGAPNIGERSEEELIRAFVDKIAKLGPQLVTFNGNGFDLPVLRYRAMTCSIAAPGLSARPYFNRYTEDSIDLCDVLSSFAPQAKATLHELCKVMGLSGKPSGIHGGEVARYVREGRIKEVADYCETDIVNTYRVWLRYELFRGRLNAREFELSEQDLAYFLRAHEDTKPHLEGMNFFPTAPSPEPLEAIENKLAQLLEVDEKGWEGAASWIDHLAMEYGVDLFAQQKNPKAWAISVVDRLSPYIDSETFYGGIASVESYEVAEELFWAIFPYRHSLE